MFNLGFLSNVSILQDCFARSDSFHIFPRRFFKFCGSISGLDTPVRPPSTGYLYMSYMFPLYYFSSTFCLRYRRRWTRTALTAMWSASIRPCEKKTVGFCKVSWYRVWLGGDVVIAAVGNTGDFDFCLKRWGLLGTHDVYFGYGESTWAKLKSVIVVDLVSLVREMIICFVCIVER